MPPSDAPEDDDRSRISVAEWERLNRPPRRAAFLRYHWRTFRFLRSSAPVSELQGKQQAFREAVIASVAFNRPDVIEWQIHLVRRYLAEHESYIVFDNSKKQEAREAIRDLCRRHSVPYVALPRNKLVVSRSHGQAMNWIVRNFLPRFGPKVFGFIDHDIFPTEPFSVAEKMQGKSIYGSARCDTPTPGGWFLWPAFSFFDGSLLRLRLDFAPSYKFHMDSGGGNWPVLYRSIDPALVRLAQEKPLHSAGEDRSQDLFMFIDGWLHVTNASNWRQQEIDRSERLVALLRQFGGPDQPDVKFDPI